MLFMPWTEQLEVGVDKIDEQHRWLVDTTTPCMLYFAQEKRRQRK